MSSPQSILCPLCTAAICGLFGVFTPTSLQGASPAAESSQTVAAVTAPMTGNTAGKATAYTTDETIRQVSADTLSPRETIVKPSSKRILTPHNRSQHTFFATAGHLTNLSTIHFKASDEGSLNTGVNLTAGYNWTSRRGLGAGVIYSGGFISARRNEITRTARVHYIAAEFVARQQAGRRWLFREAVGAGYGRYARGYGQTHASRGGLGLHEHVSVEYMITRRLGLSAEIGGELILVSAPDVGDGAELNLGGVLTFHAGGGVRLYF